MATSTNCNKCGRPMVYAKENKCNYCDSCMSEYCGCKLGRIKEIEPTCDSTAVIPSITVESVEGITNLANCLVHVNDINTTFYVDDKHRVMITWAGPVEKDDYDIVNNPNNLRSQFLIDFANNKGVYYSATGDYREINFGGEEDNQVINLSLVIDEDSWSEPEESYRVSFGEQGHELIIGFSVLSPAQGNTGLFVNDDTGEFLTVEQAYKLIDSGEKVKFNHVPVGQLLSSPHGGAVVDYTDGIELTDKSYSDTVTFYTKSVFIPYELPMSIFISKREIGLEEYEYEFLIQGTIDGGGV